MSAPISSANLEPIRDALHHEGIEESARLMGLAFDEFVLYKLNDPACVNDPEAGRVAYLLQLLRDALARVKAQA